MTLDDCLGFSKNPFFKKSAEQELSFLDDIFFEPNYYSSLKDVLVNGDSRFIIGQRGHGKSFIINKLLEDLEKEKTFVVKIDRFDTIPVKKNETALLKLIIQTIVTKVTIYIDKNKKVVKKLNKREKEKLALFIRLFFKTLSKTEYNEIYNNFHGVKKKNFFIRCFNKIGLVPLNTATSAVVHITSSVIRQSVGFDNIQVENVYRDYFGKIPEVNFDKLDLENEQYDKSQLKHILDELLIIIKQIDFETTVILFDKIDEYQNLDQDISKIATFTKEILSDTELLMNEKCAIGFSLWSELKTELEGVVRFDKFGLIDVRWSSNDLLQLINKRIRHFSVKKDLTLESIMPNLNERNEVLNVAYKSPRDLISCLGRIYQEQSNINPHVTEFGGSAISKGLIDFCSTYDYESVYPSKTGKSKDIKSTINKILQVKLTRFTLKNLSDTFTLSPAQAEGQIKLMIKYNLVREDDIMGANDVKYYEVIDPKIMFLIRRAITKIE